MKLKKIILGIAIMLLTVIFIIIAAIYPVYSEYEKTVLNEINNGTLYSNDRITNIKGGYSAFKEDKKEIVLMDFDIFNPIVSFVWGDDGNIKIQQAEFKRTGLFKFEVKEYPFTSFVENKTFKEAVELAKKYDFSKENPDPENIQVRRPPTKEEVEESRIRREAEDERNSNEDYKNEQIECIKVRSAEFKPYIETVNKSGYDETVIIEGFEDEVEAIQESYLECEERVNKKYGYESNY